MLRFRGKDVLRISKYNMLMFIILGLLGLGISVGYLCRHVPAFKGLEHSISYTIFAMLFIFGITIGANQSLLNNIGEFGIQAAILAICGVLGSLVASFIAYKLGNYIQSYSITLVKRCKDLLSHIGRIFPYKNVFLSVSLTQQLTNHEL